MTPKPKATLYVVLSYRDVTVPAILKKRPLDNVKEAISLYLEPSGYCADSNSARPEVDLDGVDHGQSFGVDYSDMIAGGMADERT